MATKGSTKASDPATVDPSPPAPAEAPAPEVLAEIPAVLRAMRQRPIGMTAFDLSVAMGRPGGDYDADLNLCVRQGWAIHYHGLFILTPAGQSALER